MKVLSIDDSVTIHYIIKKALSTLDLEVATAQNGAQGLEQLEKELNDIKLILLDWNMPGLTGFEVLQKLKSDTKWEPIPVIMLTSEGDPKNVIKAMKAGANGYIVKPFSQEDLVEKVTDLLEQSV